jgi:hypothetical protein
LRATRVFEADLLLPTRFRTLDEGAPLEACFEVGFTRDAAPVFFVFELVVFFDLLRAAIVNLSTREHYRIRLNPRTNAALTRARTLLFKADFLSTKITRVLGEDAQRLRLDD